VNRSGLYDEPLGENEESLTLMRLIDEEYTRHPFPWEPANQGMVVRPRVPGGPESRPAADAADGYRGCLSETEAEPARAKRTESTRTC
jgi:hypothetical protein